MEKITVRKDCILLIGILLVMNSTLTFLSTKYNFVGKPMYYIGGIIVLIFVIQRPHRIINSKIFLWYGVFMMYTLISVLWSIDPVDSLDKWMYIIVFHVMAICSIVVYGNTSNHLETLMKLYLIASIILCVIIIQDGPKGANDIRFGWSTTGEQANTPAMNLAASFAFSFYFWGKNKKKKIKILYLACLALFSITIFLTGSRKIFIYILGFLVMQALYASKDMKKTIAYIGGIIVALFISSYILLNNRFMYDLVGDKIFTDLSKETSAILRGALNIQAWEFFKSSPIFGHGFFSFDKVSFNKLYTHNNYLEILTGLGLIGLLLYYVVPVLTVLKLWKRRKNKLCFLFFSILCMSFVIEYWQVNYVQRGVYFIYAMAFCVRKITNSSNIYYRQKSPYVLDKFELLQKE